MTFRVRDWLVASKAGPALSVCLPANIASLSARSPLLTYPVVVSKGDVAIPDTGPDTALELVDTRATPKGVAIRPTGARRTQTRPKRLS